MESSQVRLWLGKLDEAYGMQSKQHKVWKNTIDLYNCKYFERQSGFDPERVDVHFANWYIDNLLPLVYFRDPFIFVHPKVDSRDEFADTCEESINVMWKRLSLKQQFQKVIKSGFMTPPGWIKLGYTAKVGQDVADIEKHREKSIIENIKNVLLNKKEKEPLTPEEQGILDMNISEESVFASWIPSWNILMPVGYHSISSLPWMCEYEDVPMIDFKVNPMYKNKKSVTSTREISSKDMGGRIVNKVPYNQIGSGSSRDEHQLIRLYHIWDRREQRRYTISDNDWHFEGKWPYHMDGFPYKYLAFDESLPTNDDSNIYPVNAITPILPQIIEKSQSRTMMVKYRKRAAAAILVQKGMTEEEIDALSENEMLQIIQLTNPQGAIPLVIPPLQADIYNIESIIDQDLQMATNMGQMMFQAQKGQRTATQAQIGQSGLQLKASARVDKVEDFTVSVATGLIQLMWQFMDREQIGSLIGKEVNERMWPDLPDDPEERKRIIREELQIKIDAGSTAPPKDETVDRKQLLDLSSIVNSIAPERINKGEFVKQLLKKFKFTKELDKIVISGDEEEKTAAMQETQLMVQTGTPQVVSPNENHEIHIQTHQQAAGQPVVDEHILMHGQMLGMKMGGKIPIVQGGQIGGQSGVSNQPQEGDLRPPMKSTNPEQVRQGITNQGDIMQKTQNLGIGSGAEAK